MHRRHRFRGLNRLSAFAALLIAGIVAPAALADASPADVDDFTIASFDAEYTLDRDPEGHSTLHVVETIEVLFPEFDQNRGIERAIPLTYQGVDTHVSVHSVTDAEGAPWPYGSYTDDSAEDDFRVLRIGDAASYVHGSQTFVIEYTLRNVIRSFSGVDELYWDLNGTGWAQPFESVTARLHLSPELRGALTGESACYRGASGDTTSCELVATDDGVSVAVAGLGPHETVTWAIGFDDGTFVLPVGPRQSWVVTLLPWLLLCLVTVCAVGAILLRLLVFRDAPGRGIVIAQYEGYPGLGIMEAATLLGRESRGLPAQFVQLAVTRAARLIDRGADAPDDARYRLELVDASGLDRDDAVAVASIFGSTTPGATVDLDRTDRTLGDRLSALTAKTRTEVTRGYRTRVRSRWTTAIRIVLVAIGVAAVATFVWALDNDAQSPALLALLAGVVVSGLVVFVLAGSPERLTREGALAMEHVRGVRAYLELAEADRIRMLQSPEGAERSRIDSTDREAVVKLHERLLPFAIVWGIEDRWQHELGTLYATTPTELSSTMSTTSFASFAAVHTASGFATTPPPSSSSSSWSSSGGSSFSGGSSGGGFSGGGGGGGGGGGW